MILDHISSLRNKRGNFCDNVLFDMLCVRIYSENICVEMIDKINKILLIKSKK